jgi:hypothetical protein
MPFFTALPLIAAAATAQAPDENRTLFNTAAAICTVLVLNKQQMTEDALRQMAGKAAEHYGFSKDPLGDYAARFNRNGLATLSYDYGGGECTVGVSADLHVPDVQGLVDQAGAALQTPFAHPSRDRWTSPAMSVTYTDPAANDVDRIARVTFKRGG